MAFTAIKKKMLAAMPVEARERSLRIEKMERSLARKKNECIGLTEAYDLCYKQMVAFQRGGK